MSGNMTCEENVLLSEFTTMRTGGRARFFFRAKNIKDVDRVVRFAKEKDLPLFVLGGGSNILISDEGFPGVVLKIEIKEFSFEKKEDGVCVTAGAGEVWDVFVEETTKRNLWGIENLSFIPGTVGASPVQNIGAYGVEVKDTLLFVDVYDKETGTSKRLENKECLFGYRDSLFKKKSSKYIIVRVAFLFSEKQNPILSYRGVSERFKDIPKEMLTPQLLREAVIAIRSEKLPDPEKIGTVGSFFKNPIITKKEYEKVQKIFPNIVGIEQGSETVKIPAGWLIEHVARMKGIRKGDVSAYEKQALAIVNHGNATTKDILLFAEEIKKEIQNKTNITLEYEAEYIG